jgi:mono/diheme cytochrome c family protein
VSVTLAVVGLTAAWAGAEGQEPRSVLVEAGRHEYERYCSACHGTDARGDGPVAAALKREPTDLTRIAKRNGGQFPAGRVTGFIDGRTIVAAHGAREMPVWGEVLSTEIPNPDTKDEVTRGRISLIVGYLESIQR